MHSVQPLHVYIYNKYIIHIIYTKYTIYTIYILYIPYILYIYIYFFFLMMFTGSCWFFRSCPLDSAWSSASASLESRWFFCKVFWWFSFDSVVNLQHSGLDLWHSFVSVSLAFWSSDHVDVSAHGYLCWDWCWCWPWFSGSSEWSWQEEQGGHQVPGQSAAGDLCLQGCQIWQGLCAQLWPVHICCSDRQSALAVTCFLFDFFQFLYVFVVYFFFSLLFFF